MTIGDTLRSLALQEGVRIEVVVVANGCTDGTDEVARCQIPLFQRGGHSLRVLEIDSVSKSTALNVGEAALTGHPRAFVDADVLLASNALAAVARALAVNEPRLAAPCLKFSSGAGRSGRIARLLENLPPFCNDVVGGGFYAVNYDGRQRWDQFPLVVADDAYVCSLFDRGERIRVVETSFSARFPTDEALVGVLARWRAGRQQLADLGFDLGGSSRGAMLKSLASKPHLWRGAVEFACATLVARGVARRHAAQTPTNLGSSWARADRRAGVGKEPQA